MSRVGKEDIIPNTIQPRHIAADFIQQSDSFAALGVVVANGASYEFHITTTSHNGFTVIDTPDVAIYIDSLTAATKLLSGASVTPTQWVVQGPYPDLQQTDGSNAVSTVFVYNGSGSSHNVVVTARSRAISADSELSIAIT